MTNTKHPIKRIYKGSHLQNALKCLRIYQNKRAVNWMEYDLCTFYDGLAHGVINPASIKEIPREGIEYKLFCETKFENEGNDMTKQEIECLELVYTRTCYDAKELTESLEPFYKESPALFSKPPNELSVTERLKTANSLLNLLKKQEK